MTDPSAFRYASLPESELRRLAQDPPSDPAERAALASELLQRAHDVRAWGDMASHQAPQTVRIAELELPFGSIMALTGWVLLALFLWGLLIGMVLGVFWLFIEMARLR